jgi:hypothetical protein
MRLGDRHCPIFPEIVSIYDFFRDGPAAARNLFFFALERMSKLMP